MDGDSDAGGRNGKGGSLSNGYSSLLIPKKVTPAERVRRGFLNRNAVAAAAAASISDLVKEDEDLDAYFARQKQLDQKAKEAEEAKRKEVAEGDRFADDDFQDDLDEELEWHESCVLRRLDPCIRVLPSPDQLLQRFSRPCVHSRSFRLRDLSCH